MTNHPKPASKLNATQSLHKFILKQLHPKKSRMSQKKVLKSIKKTVLNFLDEDVLGIGGHNSINDKANFFINLLIS